MVIYWIALPFALLLMGGWISSLFFVPGSVRNWLLTDGAMAFCALLIWRLWLNSRAIGRAGPFPSPRRFWRVYAPRGLLALIGLIAAGAGFGLAMVAAMIARDVEPDVVAVALGAAGVLAVIGGLMIWPLARLIGSRRPDHGDAPSAPDA